jgi:hypothetical protein
MPKARKSRGLFRRLGLVPTLQIPRELFVPNLGLTREHAKEVREETEIEREWYDDATPFANAQEIDDALSAGDLATLPDNPNYLPIMRYRNPKLVGIYPPYLRAATLALLNEVALNWRTRANHVGIDPRIRLSITGLVMSEEYRDQLIAAGKLAFDKGPHVCGEAFDIEGVGYYVGDTPLIPRFQAGIRKVFEDMQADVDAPDYINFDAYDPRVHKVLKTVLDEMMAAHKLHYAHEFPGSTNTVYHICRNPAYNPIQP